jgi:hypothetical protein
LARAAILFPRRWGTSTAMERWDLALANYDSNNLSVLINNAQSK